MDAAPAVLDDPVEQCRFTRYSSDAEGQPVANSSLRPGVRWCHQPTSVAVIVRAVPAAGY